MKQLPFFTIVFILLTGCRSDRLFDTYPQRFFFDREDTQATKMFSYDSTNSIEEEDTINVALTEIYFDLIDNSVDRGIGWIEFLDEENLAAEFLMDGMPVESVFSYTTQDSLILVDSPYPTIRWLYINATNDRIQQRSAYAYSYSGEWPNVLSEGNYHFAKDIDINAIVSLYMNDERFSDPSDTLGVFVFQQQLAR